MACMKWLMDRFVRIPSYPWRKGAIVVLLILMVLIAVRVRILEGIGSYLVEGNDQGPSDIAYILGGGRSSRVDEAFSFWQIGYVKRFLIPTSPGIADVDGVKLLPEHEITRQMLLKLGVPEESIEVLGEEASSTKAEARALANYLKLHPEPTVLVITSEYHHRRCRLLFDKAMGKDSRRVRFPSSHRFDMRWFENPELRSKYALELVKLPPAWIAWWLPW
jgi:uncharacterized SAM-binding protein YcdF (DUF218 family)